MKFIVVCGCEATDGHHPTKAGHLSAARTSSAGSCISAPTLTAAVAVNLNGSQTKSIFSMSLILIIYSEH